MGYQRVHPARGRLLRPVLRALWHAPWLHAHRRGSGRARSVRCPRQEVVQRINRMPFVGMSAHMRAAAGSPVNDVLLVAVASFPLFVMSSLLGFVAIVGLCW